MYSFPNFEPLSCSMSYSNYCFLTPIHVSQETGKVVWYSPFHIVKAMVFPVVMCELDHKETWGLKNWYFRTVVLEKTLKSPLDSKELKPVNPIGNQSWILIGKTDAEAETPILWPCDVKHQPFGNYPDAGKDWREEENGATKDEMVEWHH